MAVVVAERRDGISPGMVAGHEFAGGARVVAVAVRDAIPSGRLGTDDEQGLALVGLLVFVDRPKADLRLCACEGDDLPTVDAHASPHPK